LGTKGPLPISYPPASTQLEKIALESLHKIGIPSAADPFGGDIKGVWLTPNTYDLKTNTRTYATTAFYLPHRDRPNFFVLVAARAARIVTKQADLGDVSATGVEFLHNGKKYAVGVKKEVIVCAGTLKSPQILELSGIGRKDVLEKINVPVQVELNGVGMNVQEHVFQAMSFELKDEVSYETLDIVRDPEIAVKQLKLHSTGTGVHTSGMIGFSFMSPDMVTPNCARIYENAKQQILKNWNSYSPELQAQYKIHLARFERNAPQLEWIFLKGLFSFPNPPAPGKKHITFFNAVNHTLSRGTIHSTTDDPTQDPKCDPHYFEMEADLESMVEQVHFARRLVATSPLKDVIARELNPGAEVQTDEQIRDWVVKYFGTVWHTASSCSMLPRDIGGVVDTQLKVYGTSNIRVADLSVIPIHFAAHPVGVVHAIAEHAAEAIMGTD